MSGGGFEQLNDDEKFVLTFEIFGKKNPKQSKEFCTALDKLLKKYGAKTRVAVLGSKRPSDP
jgi:hypothetical protein